MPQIRNAFSSSSSAEVFTVVRAMRASPMGGSEGRRPPNPVPSLVEENVLYRLTCTVEVVARGYLFGSMRAVATTASSRGTRVSESLGMRLGVSPVSSETPLALLVTL